MAPDSYGSVDVKAAEQMETDTSERIRVAELEERVCELEETLDGIRSGEVDAIVASQGETCQVYAREGPDNGIGVEEEWYDRVFQMFQRLHTTDEYGGTGIGLAVAKKIVERHAGTARVESVEGAGSTSYVTLPSA